MSVKLPINKKTKMSDLINYRLKILTIDNRTYVGSLLSFDKHLNLVLADTKESRITKKSWNELKKKKKSKTNPMPVPNSNTPLFPSTDVPPTTKLDVTKRHLGLIILRGEQIVSLSIETGPLTDIKSRVTGKGTSRPLIHPVSKIKKLA
ncbi:smb1 [Candida oxycetoniae]|uniref:Sm protein B n=1 Tax=Candida oxycetoniae TaxID=497107 RepID=A0AAI9T0V2_9ASCO|nr:smb1 [Candida oxycetoniae]KAI3405970.1 smb1 [Candida oxycetoniae]